MIEVALYQPEIPPNTGNIIRLCANIGCFLHLIHPLGFNLSDKQLSRAGLDYHALTNVKEHRSFHDFLSVTKEQRLIACSTKGAKIYSDYHYSNGDILLFGPETRGLPDHLLASDDISGVITIPMHKQSRSLNLSNAVAIIAYDAWRQFNFTEVAHD